MGIMAVERGRGKDPNLRPTTAQWFTPLICDRRLEMIVILQRFESETSYTAICIVYDEEFFPDLHIYLTVTPRLLRNK